MLLLPVDARWCWLSFVYLTTGLAYINSIKHNSLLPSWLPLFLHPSAPHAALFQHVTNHAEPIMPQVYLFSRCICKKLGNPLENSSIFLFFSLRWQQLLLLLLLLLLPCYRATINAACTRYCSLFMCLVSQFLPLPFPFPLPVSVVLFIKWVICWAVARRPQQQHRSCICFSFFFATFSLSFCTCRVWLYR